jgi:hypothetical protein
MMCKYAWANCTQATTLRSLIQNDWLKALSVVRELAHISADDASNGLMCTKCR